MSFDYQLQCEDRPAGGSEETVKADEWGEQRRQFGIVDSFHEIRFRGFGGRMCDAFQWENPEDYEEIIPTKGKMFTVWHYPT